LSIVLPFNIFSAVYFPGGDMALTKRRQQMFSLVEAHRRSGLSRKEFCSKHGIALSTFSWWQHEYRKNGRSVKSASPSDEAATFVPISGPHAGAAVEYQFADGSLVRIPCSIGQSLLLSIVQSLRAQ
jgi:hypothetical protein